MKPKTSAKTNSTNGSFPTCGTVPAVLFALVLACYALTPQARATCQEGCLTNESTVLGDDALLNNTSGTFNTAMGFNALYSNTNGFNNTAVGSAALFSNGTGFDNTALGYQALPSNTIGYLNTATGSYALSNNTTGFQNTATGNAALNYNTTGNLNTATGSGALVYNTTGNFNAALGYNALLYNTTGGNNIALGASAGSNLTTGSHNIDIGNKGVHGEANTIRIGKQGTQTATFVAGISGATVPTGIAVIIDTSGHLGTTTSSARFKEHIEPMDKASEAVLALKPVTFQYKQELDPDGIAQFGLVAEEVEKVNPDLVAHDELGKPYTVRYEAVNAMLLNEFLKEHRKVETLRREARDQKTTLTQLKSAIAQQQKDSRTIAAQQEEKIEALIARLNTQESQIRKVREQAAMSGPAQRMANNE